MQKCTKIVFIGPRFGREGHLFHRFPAEGSVCARLEFVQAGLELFFPLSVSWYHACGVSSGKRYSVPITVMLCTRRISIVPLQDEVSVVTPSS